MSTCFIDLKNDTSELSENEEQEYKEWMSKHHYIFSLGFREDKEFDEIKKSIKKLYGEEGRFQYIFTPRAVGITVEIYSELLDKKFNITDYDRW